MTPSESELRLALTFAKLTSKVRASMTLHDLMNVTLLLKDEIKFNQRLAVVHFRTLSSILVLLVLAELF